MILATRWTAKGQKKDKGRSRESEPLSILELKRQPPSPNTSKFGGVRREASEVDKAEEW